jgi:hypothetical protein
MAKVASDLQGQIQQVKQQIAQELNKKEAITPEIVK